MLSSGIVVGFALLAALGFAAVKIVLQALGGNWKPLIALGVVVGIGVVMFAVAAYIEQRGWADEEVR